MDRPRSRSNKIAIEVITLFGGQHKIVLCYFAIGNRIRGVPAFLILFNAATTGDDRSRQVPTGTQNQARAILEPQIVWGKMCGFRESDAKPLFSLWP